MKAYIQCGIKTVRIKFIKFAQFCWFEEAASVLTEKDHFTSTPDCRPTLTKNEVDQNRGEDEKDAHNNQGQSKPLQTL